MKLVLCGESLACRNRNAGRTSHFGNLFWRIWWHWFFKPQWVILFELLSKSNCSRRTELTVSAKQDVGASANSFAYCAHHLDREINCMQRRLPTVKHRIPSGWIKLDPSKTAFNFSHRSLGCCIGVAVHRVICIDIDANGWIEIRICTQFVVNATTQQFVYGLASLFAADVPHGHLNTAHDATCCEVGTQRIPTAVHIAPHHLDMKRITADDVTLSNFLNHLGYKMG